MQEQALSEDEQASSPGPIALQLQVPSEDDKSGGCGPEVQVGLDVADGGLLTSWKQHSPVSEDDSSVRPFPAPCHSPGSMCETRWNYYY